MRCHLSHPLFTFIPANIERYYFGRCLRSLILIQMQVNIHKLIFYEKAYSNCCQIRTISFQDGPWCRAIRGMNEFTETAGSSPSWVRTTTMGTFGANQQSSGIHCLTRNRMAISSSCLMVRKLEQQASPERTYRRVSIYTSLRTFSYLALLMREKASLKMPAPL